MRVLRLSLFTFPAAVWTPAFLLALAFGHSRLHAQTDEPSSVGPVSAGSLTSASAKESPRDFGRDYPAGCSPSQARAIYERVLRELRGEQRAAIQYLADDFESDLETRNRLGTRDETSTMLDAERKLLAALRASSDAQTAILQAFAYRSVLSPHCQERVQAIVEQLSGLVEDAQRAKLAYQPFLADHIRQRWELLEHSEKRDTLAEYFALAGPAPDWLLRHSEKTPLPLARSTVNMLERFESRAKEQLRAAEQAFQPQRDALAAKLQAARGAARTTEAQRRALEFVLKLLKADYGKGFRGMMLLEPEAELPADLHGEVASLCRAYQAELARLRSQRAAQLIELKLQLAPLRESQLKDAEFAELMAIDTRLHELEQVLRPMRVLARRESSIDWPEDVLLMDVRDSEYHVQFLRDLHEAWLPRKQVMWKPTSSTIRSELAVHAPADGPGSPVSDHTVLYAGQTLMGYRNQSWRRVTVVDVSPLGVLIHWQSSPEHRDQLEPKSSLRTLSDQ